MLLQCIYQIGILSAFTAVVRRRSVAKQARRDAGMPPARPAGCGCARASFKVYTQWQAMGSATASFPTNVLLFRYCNGAAERTFHITLRFFQADLCMSSIVIICIPSPILQLKRKFVKKEYGYALHKDCTYTKWNLDLVYVSLFTGISQFKKCRLTYYLLILPIQLIIHDFLEFESRQFSRKNTTTNGMKYEVIAMHVRS